MKRSHFKAISICALTFFIEDKSKYLGIYYIVECRIFYKIRLLLKTHALSISDKLGSVHISVLFIGLHKGEHLWLYLGVYTDTVNSCCLLFFDVLEIKPVVCCRKEDIEALAEKRVFEQQRNRESITLIFYIASIQLSIE